MAGLFRYRSPERRPWLPRRWGALVAVVAAAPPALFAIDRDAQGPVAGLVVGVALIVLWLFGMRAWDVAGERAYLRLLGRPELGEYRRLGRWFAAFLASGLALFAGFMGYLVVLNAVATR